MTFPNHKYEIIYVNLSLLPDQKKWLEEKGNRSGEIREAIAFAMEIEAAIARPFDRSVKHALVEVSKVAGEKIFYAPFLLQNALNAIASPPLESMTRRQELGLYSLPELIEICRSDKKKYKGFGGKKQKDLIEHILQCEMTLDLDPPFIS